MHQFLNKTVIRKGWPRWANNYTVIAIGTDCVVVENTIYDLDGPDTTTFKISFDKFETEFSFEGKLIKDCI